MNRSRLPGWSRRRLRVIMVLFFLALAVPTLVLVLQAYSQLKWEAFYQHRVMAEELVQRIDRRVAELIETESARTFTDYTFLNIAGDINANFLQRSPLAAYPVNSAVPGVIGYFQVDNQGLYTSPLLPEPLPIGDRAMQQYGLAAVEVAARQQASDRVYRLLRDNNLLASVPRRNQPRSELIDSPLAESELSADEYRFDPGLSAPAVREYLSREARSDKYGGDDEVSSDLNAEVADEEDIADFEFDVSADLDKRPESSLLAQSALEKGGPVQPAAAADDLAQSGFDQLRQQSPADAATQALGRLADLKLERPYGEKLSATRAAQKNDPHKTTATPQEPKRKQSPRKEQNRLPVAGQALVSADSVETVASYRARVKMFESEIGTFELGLLESGHFVLYRNAWRDGQRSIQGLLVEPKPFIGAVIGDSFLQTRLAQTSELTVAYQGNVLTVFSGAIAGDALSSAQDLQGVLLLQKTLYAPLDGLELVFSVNNLPAGPGARLLNWLSLILLLVMAGGFWLLYRLGLGQIKLAAQQQDFVSAVSHELKTPLTSIRMYGEMLREGWATEEKKLSYYDYITDESDRLTRLINNVLQLANLTRNALPMELAQYSVAQLLDTVSSKITTQVERAGFELNIVADEQIRQQTLQVDADSFCQVVINLVDNAIKFSKNSTQQQVDISCKLLGNGEVQFTVRDYGPGIPADQMRRIFQLFYRSENELTRETAGTGIGLALVHQLVLAMGGQVDVVNANPGAGFKMQFPSNGASPASAATLS